MDAFVLRIAPSEIDRVFIRDMKLNDLVVVPHWSDFYVAEVAGPATYDDTKVEDDTAYRRVCHWLINGKAIPRIIARSALISRMKTQGTCARATDLLDEIRECVALASANKQPTFEEDLRDGLIRETLKQLRHGRMDDYRFEDLVRVVLLGLGAEEARVIPRNQEGADVVATFPLAGAFRQVVAVQAKHWRPEPAVGPDVVEQLIRGMEAEGADFGLVVTTGDMRDLREAKALLEELAA